MLAAAFFAWNTVSAEPMRVHVMQNVSAQEEQQLNTSLISMGYKPTEKALFSESPNAIIITKVLPTENEDASLTVELVHLDTEKDLPRTLFQYRMAGNDVSAMIKALPKPDAFNEPVPAQAPVSVVSLNDQLSDRQK